MSPLRWKRRDSEEGPEAAVNAWQVDVGGRRPNIRRTIWVPVSDAKVDAP